MACITGYSQATHNYPIDADAELVVAESRVITTDNADYCFTQAYSIFYDRVNQSTVIKKFNGEAYCDSVPLAFSKIDSNYVMLDSSFYNRSNYNWQFTDVADTNVIVQYSTTKPIARVANFSPNVGNIDKNNGFSYGHPIVYADSIVYIIGADSLSNVRKKLTGNSTGVSFSHTELSSLNSSNEGTLIILIYNMMPQVYNNRKYYFQNNSIFIATPVIIN